MIADRTLYAPISLFKVVSARSGLRGWLDASEMGNWLRHIQVATSPSLGNVKHVLLTGQVKNAI